MTLKEIMTNAKYVLVKGWIPYDILNPHDSKVTTDLLKFFATLSAPSWGLRISYQQTKGKPNIYGGETTYYHFEIKGTEAVRFSYVIKNLREMVRHGAEIEMATVTDLEACEIPTPQVISIKEIMDDCRGQIVYTGAI